MVFFKYNFYNENKQTLGKLFFFFVLWLRMVRKETIKSKETYTHRTSCQRKLQYAIQKERTKSKLSCKRFFIFFNFTT